MKRTLSIALSLIILFSCFEMFGTFTTVEAAGSGDTADAFFGRYFQNKVTDLSLRRALNRAVPDENGYREVEGVKYAEKDGQYYGMEPIHWLIVGEEGGSYILLSKDILASRGGVSGTNNFYSANELRTWLNDEFLNLAFTDEERKEMSKGFINYESEYPYYAPGVNPYGTHLPGDLQALKMDDYVSIPSKDDIEDGFNLDERRAVATEYLDSERKVTQYWLRGPAYWRYGNPWSYYVNTSGAIDSWAGTWSKGIRPVIKVKKNSKLLMRVKADDVYALNLSDFYFYAYDKDTFFEGNSYIGVKLSGEAHYQMTGYDLETCQEHFAANDGDNAIIVPHSWIGNSAIKITRSGFRDFLIPQKVAEDWRGRIDNFTAYTQRERNDGRPYISTVFGKADKGDTYCEMQTDTLKKVYDDTTSKIIITAVGAQKGAKYYLSQGGDRVFSSKTGEFSVNLVDKFVGGADTYAYVVNPDGTTSESVKINIDLTEYTPKLRKILDLFSVELIGKDGLVVKPDDSIPLVGGMEIDLEGVTLPVGLEFDKDTLKVSWGINIFERTASSKKLEKSNRAKIDEPKWELFKQDVKTFKDIYKDSTKKKKEINSLIKKYNAGQIQSASRLEKKNTFTFSFVGFTEIQFVPVTIGGKRYIDGVLKEGEAALSLGGKASHTQQFFAGPGIPAYSYFEFGVDAKVGCRFTRIAPDDDLPIELGWFINVEPNAKVGAGAGIKGFISGGIYGKASAPLNIDSLERRTKLSLKGEVGLEGELVVLNAEKKLLDGEIVVFDKYWDSKKSKSGVSATGFDNGSSDSSEVSVSLIPRDYLDHTSQWLAGTSANANATVNSTDFQTLQESVYAYSHAKLVKAGDKLVAFWLEDDADRDVYNRTRLVYSVCRVGSQQWSAPKPVDDNGRIDAYPSVVSDGSTVYLTWQNSNKSFNKNSLTVENLLKSFDIKAARYDVGKDSFTIRSAAENDTYDGCQTVVIENGKPAVYWSHNDSNDLNASTYSVRKYAFDTGKTETVYSSLRFISDLEAYDGNIAYLMDQDGDLSDPTDSALYFNGQKTVLSDEDSTVSFLKAASLNGRKVLLAADANSMYTVDKGVAKRFANLSMLVDGNLNIIDGEDKTKMIWTETENNKSSVYYAEYADGGFSEPVVLTEGEERITNLSIVNGGSVLYAVCNRCHTDPETNEKGTVDFAYMTIGDSADISVSMPDFSEFDLVPGQSNELTAEITNQGSQTVRSVSFTVSDGIGDDMTVEKAVDIPSGETKAVTLSYRAPDSFTETILSVETNIDSDSNTEDNIVSFEIGKPDITLADVDVVEVGDYYAVSASLINNSCADANNVELSLYCGDKLCESKYIGTVGGAQKSLGNYFVPKKKVSFTDGRAEFKAVASSGSQEVTEDNNERSCVIAEPEKPDRIYYWNNADFDEVYIYCWNTEGGNNAAWPGEKMTYLYEENGTKLYAYTPNVPYENIIFNNGNKGKQTVDIALKDYPGSAFGIADPDAESPYQVFNSDYWEQPDNSDIVNSTEPVFVSNLPGDVNNDGKLTIRDVTGIQLHLCKKSELTGNSLRLADYDGNGEVNIMDVTALQKAVAALKEQGW